MQKRARLGLIAAAFLLLVHPQSIGRPGMLGVFRWSMDDPLFGGFSAIELGPDGATFIALTDRGAWTRGQLIRDPKGRIIHVVADPLQRMQGADGKALSRSQSDSEGMALAPDGTIFVSFEGRVRVLRYAAFGGKGAPLPVLPTFQNLLKRASFEALAILPDGSLITVQEDTRGSRGNFPVYRFDGTGWASFGTLPRQGVFLPVAADLGPDGRFYVLERALLGLPGFASRVRSYAVGTQGFDDGVTVMQSAPGTYDNLEGLSVTEDATGAIRLTMISDDNFQFFQTTEMVEYLLPD